MCNVYTNMVSSTKIVIVILLISVSLSTSECSLKTWDDCSSKLLEAARETTNNIGTFLWENMMPMSSMTNVAMEFYKFLNWYTCFLLLLTALVLRPTIAREVGGGFKEAITPLLEFGFKCWSVPFDHFRDCMKLRHEHEIELKKLKIKGQQLQYQIQGQQLQLE